MEWYFLQLFYFPKSWHRMKEMESWSDKLNVLIKGPGWSPGKPRLGDPMDCPEVPIREKYDPKIPGWQTAYTAVHFLILLGVLDYLFKNALVSSPSRQLE